MKRAGVAVGNLFMSELAADATPFEILGLPVGGSLPHLEARFLEVQLAHHPDRFLHDPLVKQAAEGIFSRAVWAYEQLRDWETRAQWVLTLEGLWPPPLPPEVLSALMEWEEDVATGVRTEAEVSTEKAALQKALEEALVEKKWPEVGQTLMKLRALKKLGERVS
jgi:DnaJ-domain-containing protein 1